MLLIIFIRNRKQKLDELEKVKSQNTCGETVMKAKEKNYVIINIYRDYITRKNKEVSY